MVSVEDEGRVLYILNYVKRPSGVKDGASVFMAAGIEDDYGVPQQVIIGRGVLCAFDEQNEVRSEWVKKYDWMGHHKYYLVLKEFEVLDGARKEGLLLNQVLITIGADTYPTSEGEDISLEKLRAKHTQKMHMKITDKAVEYINGELDKIFNAQGSKKYYSDLS